MALLWLDGFEGGEGTDTQCRTYLGRRYTVGVSGSINNYTDRFLGTCIGCSNNAYVQVDVDQKQTIVIGFAFKASSLSATDGEGLLLLRDGTVTHLEIQLKSTGDLKITRGAGGTQLGITTSLGLTVNCWYYIEFKATIADGTSGSFELKVDNISVLSDSACDTNNGGNAYVTQIRLFGDDLSYKFYFDDFYILDTVGTVNNDFLGPVRVERLDPDGDDTKAWTRSAGTDNYALVDDGGIPDDDTTYVEASASTTKDLYDYESADIRDDIKGIAICTEIRETDATDYTLKTPIKSGATESDDTAQAVAGTSFEILGRVSETDPNTSAKWTKTNLNAAKFGIKVG